MAGSHDWHHTIPLDRGATDGDISLAAQRKKQAVIPDDLTGKSVLDIGTADGYYSFLAERRGGDPVVAIDVSSPEKFKFARDRLDSVVQYLLADLHSVAFARQFDVTICFGILYHFDPETVLDRLAELTGETLCLETACKPSPRDRATLDYPEQSRLDFPSRLLGRIDGLYDVCWPTRRWVDEQLRDRGFRITDRNIHLGNYLQESIPLSEQLPAPERYLPTRYALRAVKR